MATSPGPVNAGPPADSVSVALEELIERYADRVRRAGLKYGLAAGDIDDVFQDVRLRIWRALEEGGKIAGAPASYVYRTAVSATIDLLRRRRAKREDRVDMGRPSGEAMFGSSDPPDRSVEQDELARLVDREIASLSDDRAIAVRLYLSGYPREEIAALLSWSEPRARHLIYRGLGQLRERLVRRGIGPEVVE